MFGVSGQFRLGLAVTVSGGVALAIGLMFLLVGLEDADRVSSGIGAAAGVIGLVIGALGAARIRAERVKLPAATSATTIAMRGVATHGGRVHQVGQGTINIDER